MPGRTMTSTNNSRLTDHLRDRRRSEHSPGRKRHRCGRPLDAPSTGEQACHANLHRGSDRIRNTRESELPGCKGSIVVIYDTCYLMNDQRLLTQSWIVEVEQDWRARYSWETPFARLSAEDRDELLDQFFSLGCGTSPHTSAMSVTHVVPKEVKSELVNHLSCGGKQNGARAARRRMATLIDEPWYLEPTLTPLASEAESPRDGLGADSPTDRLLIRYARKVAETRRHPLVLIATDDGGINYDVASLRKRTGLPIYCISRPNDLLQRSPVHRHFDGLEVKCVEFHSAQERREDRMNVRAWLLVAALFVGFVAGLWYLGYLIPILKVLGAATVIAVLLLSFYSDSRRP